MKKLLLALVIASVAAVSQAVVLNWTYSSADTEWLTGVTSGALVYAGTEATTVDNATAILVARGTDATGYSSIAAAEGARWRPVTNDPLLAYATLADAANKNTTAGTYFIVLFDAAGKSAVAQVAATDTANAWLESVGSTTTGYKPLTGLQFQGTLVPEPTVLALLALGVAGLALRRKA